MYNRTETNGICYAYYARPCHICPPVPVNQLAVFEATHARFPVLVCRDCLRPYCVIRHGGYDVCQACAMDANARKQNYRARGASMFLPEVK